jgi:hypothetical protein
MRRLATWFRQLLGLHQTHDSDENTPLSPEEFARLIMSGKSEDMKILARTLAQTAGAHRVDDSVML